MKTIKMIICLGMVVLLSLACSKNQPINNGSDGNKEVVKNTSFDIAKARLTSTNYITDINKALAYTGKNALSVKNESLIIYLPFEDDDYIEVDLVWHADDMIGSFSLFTYGHSYKDIHKVPQGFDTELIAYLVSELTNFSITDSELSDFFIAPDEKYPYPDDGICTDDYASLKEYQEKASDTSMLFILDENKHGSFYLDSVLKGGVSFDKCREVIEKVLVEWPVQSAKAYTTMYSNDIKNEKISVVFTYSEVGSDSGNPFTKKALGNPFNSFEVSSTSFGTTKKPNAEYLLKIDDTVILKIIEIIALDELPSYQYKSFLDNISVDNIADYPYYGFSRQVYLDWHFEYFGEVSDGEYSESLTISSLLKPIK